jgi:hypothetical protein
VSDITLAKSHSATPPTHSEGLCGKNCTVPTTVTVQGLQNLPGSTCHVAKLFLDKEGNTLAGERMELENHLKC